MNLFREGRNRSKYLLRKRGVRMSSTIGLFSIIGIFVYGIMIMVTVLVVYALLLAIKALKIYIGKNS